MIFTFTSIIACHLVMDSSRPSLPCGGDCKSHYENTPMQYTSIFHSCKNDNFQMKNCDVFLIFAQNIDSGYTLEPPQ